jgi:hypothetical protein
MIAWLTRVLAPVWREIALAAGALIAILAILRRAERSGERNERLRQKEADHDRARQIRDAVDGVDRDPGVRPDDRRGYRD